MAAPTNVAEGAVKGLKEAFNSMDKGQMIAALICSITDNATKSELSNLKNKEK